MGEKLHKDIVFYSNLDEYSNKIIQELSGKNEKDNFIYICVDDPNIQLPDFLTAVPTIYLVKDQKVLVDEKVQEFVNDLGKPKQGFPADEELGTYFSPNMSFSSSFSMLDNSTDKAENSIFSYLDGADNSTQINPKGGLENNMKSSTNDAFEKLAAQRQNDFKGIQRT
jgi:hypothetical protein